jgi:tetratricopeptide (TPR) repeat protein
VPAATEFANLITEARAAADRNDHGAAFRILDDVLARDPQNQEARRLRGDLYFKDGDLDKAMADFGELRTEKAAASAARRPARPAADPLSVAELLRHAGEQAHRRAHDRAIESYNYILTLDIRNSVASTALQNRGNVYRAKNELERALQDYDQAIRFNPANAGAYINRGTILAERGDHEAALKDYDEALRFNPKYVEALYNRGVSLRETGRPELAGREFEKALELKPDFALARAAYGLLLLNERNYARARRELERARRHDPGLAQVWFGLAQLDQHAGEHKAARANLEKAITLAPDHALMRNFAGWLYATSPVAALRDGRKAIEHARRACELTGWTHYGFVDTLAAAFAEVGDFAQATNFQWYALSLWDSDDESRAEAEERLTLFQKRRPYRERARPENMLHVQPGPDAKPKQRQPLSPAKGGPVGMSSPPLRLIAGRADCWPALLLSGA